MAFQSASPPRVPAPLPDNAENAKPSGLGKKAGKATLIFMACVLLSRVLGVVRDIVLNRLFGQGPVTDTYTAAFRIPDILYLLVAGGSLSSIFVPVFAEYWSQDKQAEAWKTFGNVMSIVGVAAFLMIFIAELFAVTAARLLNPLFTPEAVMETARISRILLPAQWCFFVGGLMMGTLNARQRFLVPALGPVVYNVGIVLGGIFFHRTLGIASFAYGAVGGAFVGSLLLPLWDLKRADAQFSFGFDTRHPGVRKVGRLMLPSLLGLGLSQLVFWVTPTFLPGDGTISALRNGYNLTQAPIGVFAQATAIVLLPAISILAAQKQWHSFRKEVSLGVRRVLFMTIPASVLMAALAEPIITTLYLSPKFDINAVHLAANALRFYSLGTFAWSAQAVIGRGFYAVQDTKTPVIISTTLFISFVVLCDVLTRIFHLGYLSLAAATSFISVVNMVVCLITLQNRVGSLDVMGIVVAVVKISAASLLASGAALGLVHFLQAFFHVAHPGKAVSFVILVIAGGAGLVLYGAFCLLFRVSEVRGVREMFKKR